MAATTIINNNNSNIQPIIGLRLRFLIFESLNQAKCFPAGPSRYIGSIANSSNVKANMSAHQNNNQTSSDRSIVLVGMMGVGKSSVGRRLAERLNMPFVDSDDEVETAADMKIAEIFERFGEDYFRDGERRVIVRLMEGAPKIIATGGGAFINAETRVLIKEKARSIWLDTDIDILVERVSRRNHRPLLRGKNPKDVLMELGRVRNPIYAEADIHVRSDSSPHARTVDLIMKELEA
jgi:shikimate kinase